MRTVYRVAVDYGPRHFPAKAGFIFESRAEADAFLAAAYDLEITAVAISTDHILTAEEAAREIVQRASNLKSLSKIHD